MTNAVKCLAVALLACVCCVSAEVSFQVTDCAKDRSTELLTVPTARVSPYPVPIPGDVGVHGVLTLNRDIPAGGGVKLEVTAERYVGFFWLTVPCLDNVGSCTYDDACALLDTLSPNQTCVPQLADQHLPCTCPFSAATYTLPTTSFHVPEMSGIMSWLAEGDYRVTGRLVDATTGDELACQHVKLTTVDANACSGFLCSIFG